MDQDALGELALALSKAQASIKPPKKTHTAKVPLKSGGSYSYKYSSLDELIDAVRVPLATNGLAFVQIISYPTPGHIGVETVLLHASGAQFSGGVVLLPSGDTPQTVGSALTYGRRYSLGATIGVAAEDDDDATVATATPTVIASRPALPPDPRPIPIDQLVRHQPASATPAEPTDLFAPESGPVSAGPDRGTATIVKVTTRTGGTAAKPWKVWFVVLSNGQEAATFDENIGVYAERARDGGWPVRMTSEPSKKDPTKMNIVDLCADDEPVV